MKVVLALGFLCFFTFSFTAYGNPPLPFTTIGLEEFRSKYTESGTLFHGTTHRNAASVCEVGRIDIKPGSEFHVTSDFATADYDFGYEQDAMRAIIHFQPQHPLGKPFAAVTLRELQNISFVDLKQLVKASKGDELANRIQDYRGALREFWV